MKEIFNRIFKENTKLFTLNPVPGIRVYGENLIERAGKEYREWVPFRSKLSAAILKGLKNFPIKENSKILYLGAASGTTVSHISDICIKGFIYGIEFSPRVIKNLISLAEKRKNIGPVLANARVIEEISPFLGKVDLIYQDIAQKDQVEILIRNSQAFLRQNSLVLFVLKAQSISSTESVREIYKKETEKLEKEFEIVEKVNLEPYEKDHLFLVLRKT